VPDRIFLHVCCAPCSTVVVPGLRNEGFEVSGYFYNPNIHPWSEYQHRLQNLESWAAGESLELTTGDGYLLEENLRLLLSTDNRCAACFTDRFEATATKARELGFDAFSTTLTVSPWQDHDLLREVGESVSISVGLRFVYRDFRPEYRRAVSISKQQGLYRQPYCGCVMSERDRFLGNGSS
jgi:predicted adenine nucleotide alpha hydrolase (AANH) superfamily ATPase